MGYNLKFGIWKNNTELEYVLGCNYVKTIPDEDNAMRMVYINVYAQRFGKEEHEFDAEISMCPFRTYFKEKLFENKKASKFLDKYFGNRDNSYLDQILKTIEFCALNYPAEVE